MSKDRADANAQAELNLQRSYGCCCKCCSIRVEMWCFCVFDFIIILGSLKEFPKPDEDVPMLRLFIKCYVCGVVIPSFFVWLYALLGKTALARRVLCRFITYKIPAFVLVYGFFFVFPAPEYALNSHYYCDPNAAVHGTPEHIAATHAILGSNVEECAARERYFISSGAATTRWHSPSPSKRRSSTCSATLTTRDRACGAETQGRDSSP